MSFWEQSSHSEQEFMTTVTADKNHLNFNMSCNKNNFYFFYLFSLCNFLSQQSSCVSFRREMSRNVIRYVTLNSWGAVKYWDDDTYMNAHTQRYGDTLTWISKNRFFLLYVIFFLFNNKTTTFPSDTYRLKQ